MQFAVVGTAVIVGAGSRYDFGRQVRRVVDIGDRLVVLLDPQDGSPIAENIVCVNSTGQLLWRVERFVGPHGHTPYGEISVNADGRISAHNLSGIMAILDPRSGRVVDSYVAK